MAVIGKIFRSLVLRPRELEKYAEKLFKLLIRSNSLRIIYFIILVTELK
jgi:hypothetical protein